MILKTSLLLSFLGFVISFGISSQALGLDQGQVIHEQLMAEHKAENREEISALSFSQDGPRSYEGLANSYGRLSLLFFLILLAKFIETTGLCRMSGMRILCRIVLFFSLFLIAYDVRKIVVDNSYVEPTQWEFLENRIAHTWINYPWMLLFVASTVLVLDFLALFPRFQTKREEMAPSISSVENGI